MQRVFGRLANCLGTFDQQTRSFDSRLGLGRGISCRVHQSVYKRHLKFDLLATQRGRRT